MFTSQPADRLQWEALSLHPCATAQRRLVLHIASAVAGEQSGTMR
jgi:hypothetical protein